MNQLLLDAYMLGWLSSECNYATFEAQVTMSDICTSGFVTYIRAHTLAAKVVCKSP